MLMHLNAETVVRDLADKLPGALFQYIVRPDGTDGVGFVSGGCVELWELDAESVVTDASLLWAQVHPDDRNEMMASVARSRAELSDWYHEWRIIPPSGKLKWVRGIGRPHAMPDGSVVWTTYNSDITEEVAAKLAAAKLEHELDRLSQADQVTQALASVIHETAQPLAAVANYLFAIERAVEALPGVDGPDGPLSLLERAAEQARRVGRIMHGLRDLFSRTPVLQPEPIAELLGEAALMFRAATPGGAPIELDLPDIGLVEVDRLMMQQALLNLLRNASEAVAGLAEGRITLGLMPQPQGARIRVIDNGHGIAEEVRGRIFQPFVSGKPGGLGMGLSICRTIIAAHGGELRCEENAGGGACFVIDLYTQVT